MKIFIFSLIIAAIFLTGVGLTFLFLRSSSSSNSTTSATKPAPVDARASGYAAVFLDNGQVYFGRLSGFGGDRPVLRDVYYLRLSQSLQDSALAKDVDSKANVAASKNAAAAQPELTLIKLGNELHGPVDELQLNPNHTIFVEDLRKDGKITLAIDNYRKGNK